MKKLLAILLFSAILLTSILPISYSTPILAEADPLMVNSSQLWLDFPNPGTTILQLYITNSSHIDKQATVSLWIHYIDPDSNSQWIPDPSWISAISPDTQLLTPGTTLLSNITVTVPENTPDGQYITWLRVNDGTDWNKPIVLIIRVGTSVPTYSYALSNGSYYRLTVTGYNASAITDSSGTSGIFSPIAIRSKCNATMSFAASVELPGNLVTLGSPNSSIPYSTEEAGITFTPISLSDSQSWLTLPSTPIEVGPFALGFIPWSISIPPTLSNGYYETWIRISPSEDIPQMIGIEYCSRILIKVSRTPSKDTAISLLSDLFRHLTQFPYYFIPISMVTSIIIIYLLHRRSHAIHPNKLLRGNGKTK